MAMSNPFGMPQNVYDTFNEMLRQRQFEGQMRGLGGVVGAIAAISASDIATVSAVIEKPKDEFNPVLLLGDDDEA